MRISKLWALLPMLIFLVGEAHCEEKNFMHTAPEAREQISVLHKKADALVVLNKFHQAIQLYLEIILLEPDDDAAYANMGQAYLILGDNDHAKRSFIQALNINPNNDLAYFGLKKIADPDGVMLPREDTGENSNGPSSLFVQK